MKIQNNFIGSRMNKSSDERLLQPGEYVDAVNIRVSSDEDGQAGSVENAKGNERLSALSYLGANIPNDSICIGAYEDGSNEKIYWFVTSSTVDMIVSYDTKQDSVIYHVISTSVLNFNEDNLINGINLIDDLLFFTDNYNQPRRINVNQSYKAPISGVDQIDEDDISVIVKPPIKAPELTLINRASKENYMEDKFIRFSYRYKYKNGEYSALSEFSKVAFAPKGFRVDYANYEMSGMRNSMNAVSVKFNTGQEDVVEIDLCFKLSNVNTINVVERYNKENEGWTNSEDVSITFDNQKIYTTLPDSELLRTYDNVPKLAKAQTTIGNRIMYANYVDGHNVDTIMDYNVDLISKEIGYELIPDSTSNGANYVYENISVDDSKIDLDLSDVELKMGGSLFIDLNILSSSFGGDASYGVTPENFYQESFQYIFPRDYVSVMDLATDADFLSSIQTAQTIGTVNEGYSLTDLFYSNITVASGWNLVAGGVDVSQGSFKVSSAGNTLSLQVPAVKFESVSSPGTFAYEYFLNSSMSASISQIGDRRSLHSNRDYELGIVYLDEYNRASTAMVCKTNTIFIPSSQSDQKNSIKATIKNLAPSWAKRYRFVLKPSRTTYETIYSKLYYYDSKSGAWWCSLEGDNQTKAKIGDKLIVKSSGSGVSKSLVKTKVLDLKTQQEDFLEDIIAPSGLYMKIKPSGYSINPSNDDVQYGQKGVKNLAVLYGTSIPNVDFDDTIAVSASNPSHVEYSIPAGSSININFRETRGGSRNKNFEFDRAFLASRDYDNFYDFIVGEHIDFNNATNDPEAESHGDPLYAEFFEDILESYDFPDSYNHEGVTVSQSNCPIPFLENRIGIQYGRDLNTGKAFLMFQRAGALRIGKNFYTTVEIEANLSSDLLIFETEANLNDSETYYEGHKSFPIENQYHTANITNQTSSTHAVCDVSLHDCFSFGNGVESYKVNDGLAEPGLKIGPRVTAVSKQDYKETRRYADITYSGVYNNESNVNKLNEFNLALVNWKTLENSFGPIEKMHSRETDLLILQEDKISKVLTGKNLLSDAAGGGAITSSLEVLGTQISRMEEYGISNDPESFASYGNDVYFTDSKRGAVINLTGDSLTVLSDQGMSSWFRDRFIQGKNNFKLGGYDPYSKEYVLSMTDTLREIDGITLLCDTGISQAYEDTNGDFGEPYTYTVTLENLDGIVPIDYSGYTEPGGGNYNPGFTIQVSYNGVEVINEFVSTFSSVSGQFTFNKYDSTINECTVTVTPRHTNYSINVGCVQAQSLTVIRMVRNTDAMKDKIIHHDYSWVSTQKSGPNFTDEVVFGDGPVSLYETATGVESVGIIPEDGSVVTMRFIKENGDTADFDSDKFKYLVSSTLYTQNEIETLVPLLQETSAIINPTTGVYEGSFTYSNPSNHQYLYMVWDYVEPLITCDSSISAGGSDGLYELNIEIGTQIGDTFVEFDSYGVPDRFQIIWNGNVVADSLFIGDSLPSASYESEITSITLLPKFLYDGSDFVPNGTEAVNYSASDIADPTVLRPTTGNGSIGNQLNVVGGYPTGTPNAADGNVKIGFDKTANHPTTITVRAIGVNSSTAWALPSIGCPDGTSSGIFGNVIDVTPPVITLIGSDIVNIPKDDVYIDAGATAFDNIDGDITSLIVLSGTVNTAIAGLYELSYNVTDSSGNHATTVNRTVNVQGTQQTVYTWKFSSGETSGSNVAPTGCVYCCTDIYSLEQDWTQVFTAGTSTDGIFFNDIALSDVFEGGSRYFGVASPGSCRMSERIVRMDNTGNPSSIDFC